MYYESQNGRKNMAKVVLTTQRITDYMRNKSNIRPAPDRIFLLERNSLSVEFLKLLRVLLRWVFTFL